MKREPVDEHHHHVMVGDERHPDRFVCSGDDCWEPDTFKTWGQADIDLDHRRCTCGPGEVEQ